MLRNQEPIHEAEDSYNYLLCEQFQPSFKGTSEHRQDDLPGYKQHKA